MQLETPRLILREFHDEDFEAFCEIDSNPQTMRHEPQEGPDGVRAFLQQAAQEAKTEPRAVYRLAVTIRPADAMRGLVTLALSSEMPRAWEIGWVMHPAEWGRGYAVEAASRLLDFAFHELDAHRIFAFCNAGNRASERVMLKLGMRHEGTTRQTRLLRGEWHDELLYAILESEWAGFNS